MKKILAFWILLNATLVFGQDKYALVIGNSNYHHFGTLKNPVNDANDMEIVLRDLGFIVEKVLNGTLSQMENATVRLKNRLTEAGNNSLGFFFYAGHGVEMGGINYLIPSDANIPDRNFLRERAFSAQIMLDMLNDSRNALNVVVLDACRDFPAVWSRNLNRGLAVISNPPANHIIMYATGAGTVASDGNGRNGLFTGFLLNNLKQANLDVNEIFRRTMGDVARASKNEQRPALYTDFAETVYFNPKLNSIQTTTNQPVINQSTVQIVPEPIRNNRISETYNVINVVGTVQSRQTNGNLIQVKVGDSLKDDVYLDFENGHSFLILKNSENKNFTFSGKMNGRIYELMGSNQIVNEQPKTRPETLTSKNTSTGESYSVINVVGTVQSRQINGHLIQLKVGDILKDDVYLNFENGHSFLILKNSENKNFTFSGKMDGRIYELMEKK